MGEREPKIESPQADLIVADNEMYDLVVEGRVSMLMPGGKFQPGQKIQVGMARAAEVNKASHIAVVESVEASDKDNQEKITLVLEK